MRPAWGFVLAIVGSVGIGAADAKAPKPLFDADAMIHLTIAGPLPSGSSETRAMLSVDGDAADQVPVTLGLRGITRRSHDICPFPPLRITFPDAPPETSLFRGQKKLKLVTHCRLDPNFQQYVQLEHAAYRLYNVLTPLSYRVRLATVDYSDAAHRHTLTRLGFLIEDIGDVARRNHLRPFKDADGKRPDHVPLSAIGSPDAARFALFEYMIGNLDWAMTAGPAGVGCCHNSRLLEAKDGAGKLIPVPYDFDFAGLVSVPYAAVPAGMKLASVRVRRYRGYCRDNAAALPVMDDMIAHKAELLGQIDAEPQLNPDRRETAKAYLGAFFDQIADPADRERLLKTCLR